MRTFKFFLFCFFSSFTITSVTYAQTAEYEYTFTFSDEFNNSQELILGKDPFGTDGIDTLFGEEFIPQVPTGESGVRFQLPPDTSITTIKDVRFGCYWATGHEHLIDLNYQTGSSSISVVWEWDPQLNLGLMEVMFINPYNGQTIASYSWFSDSSHFYIPPSLDKIEIWTLYNGTLSSETFVVLSPNGGEILEAAEIYAIEWWKDELGLFMDIEFSSDSGTTWSYIVEDLWTYQISSYDWQVPFINSENCLIRIGDYPCRYDVSDSVFTITNPVSIEEEKYLPKEFSLSQNYPNPFNPSTTIRFTIPTVERFAESLNNNERIGNSLYNVLLKVYDILGNEVATLVNEELPDGEYEVEWNASDLPSGIYFYQLRAGDFVETRKMLLIK